MKTPPKSVETSAAISKNRVKVFQKPISMMEIRSIEQCVCTMATIPGALKVLSIYV